MYGHSEQIPPAKQPQRSPHSCRTQKTRLRQIGRHYDDPRSESIFVLRSLNVRCSVPIRFTQWDCQVGEEFSEPFDIFPTLLPVSLFTYRTEAILSSSITSPLVYQYHPGLVVLFLEDPPSNHENNVPNVSVSLLSACGSILYVSSLGP